MTLNYPGSLRSPLCVYKSFRRNVKNLKRFRVLPRRVPEAIYFRSIVPSVTYGVLVWGTCTLSCYVMLN